MLYKGDTNRLEIKGRENIYHAYGNHVTILISGEKRL